MSGRGDNPYDILNMAEAYAAYIEESALAIANAHSVGVPLSEKAWEGLFLVCGQLRDMLADAKARLDV